MRSLEGDTASMSDVIPTMSRMYTKLSTLCGLKHWKEIICAIVLAWFDKYFTDAMVCCRRFHAAVRSPQFSCLIPDGRMVLGRLTEADTGR